MEEGGTSVLEQNQPFKQNKLNAENMFVNQHDIKNTFPVVIENPLSMIQAFPNTNGKQAKMINEMTGYFSEYGNLTIFLDTSVINNENSSKLLNADVNMHNCCVMPDSTTIESTSASKPTAESAPPVIKNDAVSIPDPIEFISVSSFGSDLPEYIELDALALTPSFSRNPPLPKNKIISNKVVSPEIKTEVVEMPVSDSNSAAVSTPLVPDNDSDDEVVFVKEYRVGTPTKVDVPSKKCVASRDVRLSPLKKFKVSPKKCKSSFVPRRNPKRKAQLQKNYDVDFEFDFSVDHGEDDCSRIDYTDAFSIRRSPRTLVQPTKSSSSASSTTSCQSPIPIEYMREWPVDGMHERPNYNPLTGEIEKYDHVPKPKTKPVITQTAMRTVKKGKRRAVQTDAKKKPLTARQKLLEAERISKEFAVLTHETFHDMIDYVKQLKRANELINKVKRDDDDSNDKFNDDLQKVKDILLDNSIFYCLANNVTQKNLAKYFVEGFKLSLNGS